MAPKHIIDMGGVPQGWFLAPKNIIDMGGVPHRGGGFWPLNILLIWGVFPTEGWFLAPKHIINLGCSP